MDPTERMERTWKQGGYDELATHYLPMASGLVQHTGVTSDDHVLDVACGTGNVAITAARQGAEVTGIDITPTMLEKAEAKAAIADAEDIAFREGDAADLPFDENAFDVTLSNLGHMYGDPPDRVAAELVRVTRPGGRIGFTSWTPTDVFPFMAGVMTTYLPGGAIPQFTEPPFMWGDSDTVRDRLEGAVEDIECVVESLQYPALSPAHFWEEMATRSGTFIEFLESVEDDDRGDLRNEMIETIRPYFREEANAVELQYLRTVARV